MLRDFEEEILVFTIKVLVTLFLVHIVTLSLILLIAKLIKNGYFKVNVPNQEVYIIYPDEKSDPFNIKKGKCVDSHNTVWTS